MFFLELSLFEFITINGDIHVVRNVKRRNPKPFKFIITPNAGPPHCAALFSQTPARADTESGDEAPRVVSKESKRRGIRTVCEPKKTWGGGPRERGLVPIPSLRGSSSPGTFRSRAAACHGGPESQRRPDSLGPGVWRALQEAGPSVVALRTR